MDLFILPAPAVTVLDRRVEAGGRRLAVDVKVNPLNPQRPATIQVADRLLELAHFAHDEFQRLERSTGSQDWSMSVVLEIDDRTSLLEYATTAQQMNPLDLLANVASASRSLASRFGRPSHRKFGLRRRLNNPRDIEQHLIPSLVKAFENLDKSSSDVSIEQLVFQFRFDSSHRLLARGKMKSHIRKTIASTEHTKGLAHYSSKDGLCGYQAVIFALVKSVELRQAWLGADELLGTEYPTGRVDCKKLRESKRKFQKLGYRLAAALGHHSDREGWLVTAGNESTACTLVRRQPHIQVIIYNEVTRQLIEQRRGTLFDVTKAKEHTIILSYTLGHLQLVNAIFPYMGKTYNNGSKFCYNCLRFTTYLDNHRCEHVAQCDKCLTRFIDEQHRGIHTKRDMGGGMQCPRCSLHFYNKVCFNTHRCRASHIALCEFCNKKIFPRQQHHCGLYRCVTCLQNVEHGHRCPIAKLDEPESVQADEAGANYWAFDLESMLLPMPDGSTKHQVNLIVLRRCFAEDEELIFRTMDEFIAWIEALQVEAVLFAHNLKGYDGRMVFDFLFDKHIPPQNMMWRGCKIMRMEYGKATFKDTLLHLPASLEQLPGMFGLDQSQFKKGFFPYRFNIPENQCYIGPIPAKEFFDPHMMSPRKKHEFEQWYSKQTDLVYDFAKELLEYCQSDVRILAKAIEAYMSEQMRFKPINPFSCTTIASYAMKMYRTYYMPENTLYRLSSMEHDHIAQAMHGGRTDARCLLKEWTPEQIAKGIFGCYQDVQSLYPTVQFFDALPIGPPQYKVWQETQPTKEELMQVFGYVCCDISPKRYLHHPVLVDTDPETGRLVADLKPKTKIVVPTPELHLALKNGYEITKVYWWHHFEKSTELFKSYFRDFLRLKIEASGWPKWIRTEEDWQEFHGHIKDMLGIELIREDLRSNPAKKVGSKLLCNSLWGKFAERLVQAVWERFLVDAQDDQIMALENKWLDGEIDIHYRKYSGNNESVGMIYSYADELPSDHILQRKRRAHTNIALAAMVTSHARCRLWQELNKLGDRVLYHDTDSIIYERHPDKYNIPVGRYLGEWEDETDGCPIIRFASTGPKCYSYTVLQCDGSYKHETKVKGITLHSTNADLVNYETMKDLVLGNLEKLETQGLMFRYNRQKGEMTTRNVLKLFRMTYEKGYIDRSTWKVYPFGWEQFYAHTSQIPSDS